MGHATTSVTYKAPQSQKLCCCSQEQQSLPLRISRNAISDQRQIEQAQLELNLNFQLRLKLRLGAFLAALTKQVKCKKKRSIDRQSSSFSPFSPFHSSLIWFANFQICISCCWRCCLAACVRCAMINCCRCTQSSSFSPLALFVCWIVPRTSFLATNQSAVSSSSTTFLGQVS